MWYAQTGGSSSYATVASWDDLATLEPATEGTYALITGGVLGAKKPGDALVVRYSSGWGLPSSDAMARAYMAAHPIPNNAPTIPQPQRIVTLGQGVNTAMVSGSTQTYSVRIVNESAESWETISLEYLAVGDADILAVWAGVQADAGTGGPREPDGGVGGFVPCLFSGVEGKTIAGGTFSSPEVVWTDVTTLSTPCPPGGAVVLRWIFGGGSVSFVRAGRENNWPSGLVLDPEYGAGDAGSVVGNLSNVVPWSSGYAPPLHAMRVGFVAPTPEIQVMMFGDSVVEQERPLTDPANNSREGFIYLSEVELENVHPSSGGQGGATLDEAANRVSAQLPSLVGIVDVVGYQTPSHNQRAPNVASIGPWLARVAAVKAEVEAAGLAFFPFTLTGPSDDYTADEIAAWNAIRAALLAAYPTTYVDAAPAVMTGSVNNAAYMDDKVHINGVGGPVAQAEFWPKLLTTLGSLGYTVT